MCALARSLVSWLFSTESSGSAQALSSHSFYSVLARRAFTVPFSRCRNNVYTLTIPVQFTKAEHHYKQVLERIYTQNTVYKGGAWWIYTQNTVCKGGASLWTLWELEGLRACAKPLSPATTERTLPSFKKIPTFFKNFYFRPISDNL